MEASGPRQEREHYVLATGRKGEGRLHLLNAVYGPSTKSLFTDLGIRPGMSVADIGCGTGDVARWLAAKVGTSGSVVGVDNSTEQLAVARQEARSQGLTQLRYVEGNAYSTGLDRESFDLVCCRSLLSHLKHPEQALLEMSALVKPGGFLVCEDVDMGIMFTEPPTEAYAKVIKIFLALGKAIPSDVRIGSKLATMFREAGYPEPHIRTDQPSFRRGESKRLWEYTFLELVPEMLKLGVITDAEVAELQPELARISLDESITIVQVPKYQVWARKDSR